MVVVIPGIGSHNWPVGMEGVGTIVHPPSETALVTTGGAAFQLEPPVEWCRAWRRVDWNLASLPGCAIPPLDPPGPGPSAPDKGGIGMAPPGIGIGRRLLAAAWSAYREGTRVGEGGRTTIGRTSSSWRNELRGSSERNDWIRDDSVVGGFGFGAEDDDGVGVGDGVGDGVAVELVAEVVEVVSVSTNCLTTPSSGY